MNRTGPPGVEYLIWEEIARELERERGVERCFCFNPGFREYLESVALPFPLEDFPGSGDPAGGGDLFLGWQVVEAERELLTPEAIFSALRAGGEARLFGFYSSPRPEDLREWEVRASGTDRPGLPPPGAVSLGTLAGWLKAGPFNRYTIRKRGIFYDCRLQKDA